MADAPKPAGLTIRRADARDVAAVLRLFDEAVAWFARIGNEAQWGTEPWSAQERRVAQIYESCGYVRSGVFDVDGWPGQVLERKLVPGA